MSGGSYDYLCFKETHDILESSEIEKMAKDLSELGYAEDVAKETYAFILHLKAREVLTEAYLDRLKPVWKAMEWWQSCDWNEDTLKKTIAEYRGEKPTP